MSLTIDQFLAAGGKILPVVETIATMLLPEAAPAVSIGVKIAQGVAAEIPEAIALWEQFQSGAVPSQAELDAYAEAEDGAYAQLMADIAAKRAAN